MSAKRLRFNYDDDLCLLREVIGQNPIRYPDNWKIVQANLKSQTGKEFLIRTLKDHLRLLLKIDRKKFTGDKYRIGTEAIYSEKDVLLREIKAMVEEDPTSFFFETNEVDVKHEVQNPSSSAEINISEAFCEEPRNDSLRAPIVIRKNCVQKNIVRRKNAIEYITQKSKDKDQEIKLKELELMEEKYKLEARKIEIEERRLEMEIEDRKRKSDLEYEKFKLDINLRADLQALIASQQKIIDNLIQRLAKYEDC